MDALAFRKGEGPPMAPPGWKWMTGKRARDTCFVSPCGQRFRSQVRLQAFLHNIPNPPSPHEFRWRVSSSDFKNVPLPGIEKKRSPRGNIKILFKEMQKQGKQQRRKSKIQCQKLQHDNTASLGDSSISGNPIARVEVDNEQDIVIEIPVSQGQKRKRSRRHKSKVCQFCCPLGHKLGHPGVGHNGAAHHRVEHHVHCLTVEKGKTHCSCDTSVSDDENTPCNMFKGHNKESTSSVNHSEHLHEAARVVQAFLKEMGELKKNGDIQVDELRKILLNWTITRESMKQFPLNVISAFVLLTRNEAAPSALGRRALVRLCTKWYCKHKRFWCLLEEHRIDYFFQKFISDTSLLDQFYVGQNKSEAGKHQCIVNPFLEGQHIENHSAVSVPEASPQPKVFGITDCSDNVGQCGSSCYKNKPCRECKQYQTIRDALANCFDIKQGMKRVANQSTDSCDNPIVSNERLNGGPPTSNNNGASDEAFLSCKTKNHYSSVHPGDDGDGKCEDLSNNVSVAMHDQNLIHATFHPQRAISGDMFDVNLGVDTADYEAGGNNGSENRCLDSNNEQFTVKLASPAVEIGHCKCKSCSANVQFCQGCMCYVCHLSIQPDETWSYIKCSCCHVFHLECIIKERIAGVVEEQNIDAEFLCSVCSVKSDLFPFWRERLKNASEIESKDTLQKHLKSAISVMDGTRRKRLKALNYKVSKAYESVLYSSCSDVRQLLLSILEDVKSQRISKKYDGLLDKSFQVKENEMVEAQKLVSLSQKVSERDLELYQRAKELVAARKELLLQAEENLKNAEAEMQLANQKAKSSASTAKKARKRLELLQLYYKPSPVTKEPVEVQHELHEQVLELRRIQRMMSNINCCCEESLPELSLLVENMKQQRKKVEAALGKVEHMDSLCNF